MTNILTEIAEHKKVEVAELKSSMPLAEIERQLVCLESYSFRTALESDNEIHVIAELKKASPSKGIMTADFNPVELASRYKEGGASALSVLTDRKYFGGSAEYLKLAKEESGLPVLCKDFIVDAYQIFHARFIMADAVLLIVRLLDAETLEKFLTTSTSLGMAALVEVHDERELSLAIDAGAEIIGVNNRNLDDFSVSLEVSEKLSALIPNNILKVSESGIFNVDDARRLKNAGYNNFLIGEALVRSDNPMNLLKSIKSA